MSEEQKIWLEFMGVVIGVALLAWLLFGREIKCPRCESDRVFESQYPKIPGFYDCPKCGHRWDEWNRL